MTQEQMLCVVELRLGTPDFEHTEYELLEWLEQEHEKVYESLLAELNAQCKSIIVHRILGRMGRFVADMDVRTMALLETIPCVQNIRPCCLTAACA